MVEGGKGWGGCFGGRLGGDGKGGVFGDMEIISS